MRGESTGSYEGDTLTEPEGSKGTVNSGLSEPAEPRGERRRLSRQ